jgi:hypothetical protein
MIKIVSGFSYPVGSTLALVNFCNQMNDRGHACMFYGPDRWHLDKCKSAGTADFCPEKGDIIIAHNIILFSSDDLYRIHDQVEKLRKKTGRSSLKDMILKKIPGSRKHVGIKLILSCQENALFPIGRLNHALFDKIHYVHESQINYHKVQHDHFICPNFDNPLTVSKQKPDKVAGVIGSIRKENRTDLSIEKALQDGMKTVILYGYLIDPVYYYDKIEFLTKKYPGQIRFAGFIENKQKMYDSISDVYCAVSKPWSLVQKECRMTQTRFHVSDAYREEEPMTNDQIFAVWKNELGL